MLKVTWHILFVAWKLFVGHDKLQLQMVPCHVRFQLETEETMNPTLCKLHEVSWGGYGLQAHQSQTSITRAPIKITPTVFSIDYGYYIGITGKFLVKSWHWELTADDGEDNDSSVLYNKQNNKFAITLF